MMLALERQVDHSGSRSELERRNRRVAASLVGWIVFLIVISIIVIWTRN